MQAGRGTTTASHTAQGPGKGGDCTQDTPPPRAPGSHVRQHHGHWRLRGGSWPGSHPRSGSPAAWGGTEFSCGLCLARGAGARGQSATHTVWRRGPRHCWGGWCCRRLRVPWWGWGTATTRATGRGHGGRNGLRVRVPLLPVSGCSASGVPKGRSVPPASPTILKLLRAQQEKGRGGFEQGRGTGWTAGEGVHGRLRHEPGATLGGAVWTGAGPRRPTCANTSGRRPLLPLRPQTPDGARSTWSRRRTRTAPLPARPALCSTLPH